MAEPTELETLRAEIGWLRDEVAALKRSIADATGRVKLSMREQLRCPDCGARRIAKFDEIPDFGYGEVNPKGLAVEDRGVWRGKRTEAHVQAHVCTECGLVEWRMVDVGYFADPDKQDAFTLLESEDPTRGPYR